MYNKHYMKIKIMKSVTLAVILALNIFAFFYIEQQVQVLGANTASYVEETNTMFVHIICAQQIQGEWDLSKCPVAPAI